MSAALSILANANNTDGLPGSGGACDTANYGKALPSGYVVNDWRTVLRIIYGGISASQIVDYNPCAVDAAPRSPLTDRDCGSAVRAELILLLAKAGGAVICVLVPSDAEVSLKKLAVAAGAKDAAMLPPAEAERITGYHVGGISPFGQKRRVRVFIAQSALAHGTIIVNGGRRGLQIELKPADLVRVLEARAVEVSG